jgi:hypothetical protein
MQPLSARSLVRSGSGVRAMMSIAVSVAPHVRKVLRGERGAGHVLEILVHLAESTACTVAVVDVLEQSLPGSLMAAATMPGEPLVVDDDLVHDAALRAKLELQAPERRKRTWRLRSVVRP